MPTGVRILHPSGAVAGWWDSPWRIRRPRLRGWRARPLEQVLEFSCPAFLAQIFLPGFPDPSLCLAQLFLPRSSCPAFLTHPRVLPAAPDSHQPTPKMGVFSFFLTSFSVFKKHVSKSVFFCDFGPLLASVWAPFWCFLACVLDVFLVCKKKCSEVVFWRYSGPRPPSEIVFWHTQASVW